MIKEGEEPHGEERRRQRRTGIAASPGVAIGPAHVVDRRKVPVPRRSIDKADVDAEIHRFRKGLRDTQAQIEQIKARLPHGEHRQILKAQQLMLRDPDLSSRVERMVRDEHMCAEWSVARVADEIVDTLRQADDEYFRERSSDITFLAERVLLTLRGEDPVELRPPAGAVVVAHDLPPADTVEVARTEVVGMVTAVGGQTSHSAIVARSMEIPAVVGVDDIHEQVEDGDMVIVDAIHGVVIVRPRADELEQWEQIRDRYEKFEDRVQREHGLPATAKDGTHITLRANVALEAEIGSALFHGAEGVGLYRTEFMFMERETPPTEEEHYRLAKTVLRRVAPYPVVFRTFDLGSDKPTRLVDFSERERNPAMGLRSLRLALREREMFLAQLRGLLRAAVHGPLRIMLPLVSGPSELRAALDAVDEARRQLEDSRMAFAQEVPVGSMIEMPSAAIIADRMASHVDFMSIGTNDLIQYTLAIDRDNDDVGYLYRPLHPAVLRLVRGVAEAGRQQGIGVSLCGEMAADPRYTWVLVGLGVRELSMHPSAIPVIKNIIRSSEIEEMEALAQRVLAAADVDEAERMVLEVMRERFPEHLQHGGGQMLWVEREERR
ncbi:MAG: phosphoenolpyruvate--protein phosphotransferase [Myxococcales bacterium]|nr:phosphoenolpyruvate--protein phosphotransferase [Myxococcales bacterium]MCB9713035.1 phosphoenolpyruvate--protein phosphotransferase [Myxococcales bacterium]